MKCKSEQKLVDAIEYHLTCGPLIFDTIGIWRNNGFIKFKVPVKDNTELKIEFYLNTNNELRTIIWRKHENSIDWGFPIYKTYIVPVPDSEEEYFQYSTIHLMAYSYEFFQYIKSILLDKTETETIMYHETKD